MTDDALIEAMARAAVKAVSEAKDDDTVHDARLLSMKAALAVCRPIIKAQERERCAKIADKYVKNVEPVAGTAWLIAREIREEQ